MNFQHCPVCGSDNFKVYLNPATGMWFCHAGQHGAGGQVEVGREASLNAEGLEILKLLDNGRQTVIQTEVELPPFGPLSRAARRYLHRRGFDDPEIERLGLVEWDDEHRILIPYFDREGRLIYWNSRRYSDNLGDGPKYKAAPGKHPLYVPDRGEDVEGVVIVEGALDAMAVNRYTPYMAIALGGKFLPKYLRKPLRQELSFAILYREGEVIVALDGDAQGDSLSLLSSLPLPPGMKARLACFDYHEDPGSVTPERLNEVLNGR
jgi:hypothetical protein